MGVVTLGACDVARGTTSPAPDSTEVVATEHLPVTSAGQSHSTESSALTATSTPDASQGTIGSTEETTSSTSEPSDPALRVTGRVIDFWEHPVPNVPVHIGPREALTDDSGEFTIEGVPSEYDLSLAVRIVGEVSEVYAWHYIGLTRRDPTLQIYKGLNQHTAPLELSFTGFDPDAGWRGEVAVGGQHGQRAYPLGDDVATTLGWRGPAEQVSPVRVLMWSTTEEAPRAPAEYLYSAASEVTLSESVTASVAISITEPFTPLSTHRVGFTTTNAPNTSHLATAYVRFDGGPSIQVAQEPRLSATTDPFLVTVPRIPDASVTLAALSGNGANDTPFVITYAPQLTNAETPALTFPTVSELESPAPDAEGVTTDTPFTWSDTAGTYVVMFEDLAVYQTVFVVTAEPTVTVPDLEHLAVYYPHGGAYRWAVESHGLATSVDQLCERGYLDPFSGDFLYPIGPRAGEGSFWRSEGRTFEFD